MTIVRTTGAPLEKGSPADAGEPEDRATARSCDNAKRIIVEGVVKLGSALDIRVVAEGIETEVERAIMRDLGCSVGQGFLFAAPMDEAKLHRLLDKGGDRPRRLGCAAVSDDARR